MILIFDIIQMGDKMKTIKITPRGYCHGVVNAIQTIKKLSETSLNDKITVLGMVIHNKQVIDYFSKKGIKTIHSDSKTRLELIDEINEGTIVFTAHGVSENVVVKAKAKGLNIIDTTCEDVKKSQQEIKTLLNNGYEIIYIGKHKHPESEAAQGLSDKVHIVETIEEIRRLNIKSSKIALTNQTTMSLYDIYHLTEKLKQIYPNIFFINEICNATRIRQEAVKNAPKEIEHIFVVGDKLSNNSVNLVKTAINHAKIPATLIENVEDIDINLLKNLRIVGVTSGASTPTQVTNEVISFLEDFNPNNICILAPKSKLNAENLLD